ncbi:DNA repair protein rad2 [Coemansia sp. RSA 1286]|nr:DNA repair protein rad2 [Coemansia sp. RSA 1721]KAJ2639367.1 DNA repair protein rad2 [Coemansia sp. RSA 1286]
MGVKGLWTLLEPAARPVRLESLATKRLAIDASIWLYQLLKAMKDDQGNPLEDGHILGFYRRICKLLYYDIRPVFVFDGGAPELKRLTIEERQSARESRGQDAKRAAQQLLQTQLKLHALNGSSAGGRHTRGVVGEEGAMAGPETPSPNKKRKRDEYELPPMQESALATREENLRDLRMAHPEDLRQLVRIVTRYPESIGDLGDIEVDVDSEEFKSLPLEDQHDIIVALKVRSRQTSHDRLQQMLSSSENALDFSKQQIDLLVKRNNLTQQWLQVTGNGHRMSSTSKESVSTGRVIGERNREYMLVKNDNSTGGWTLKMAGGSAISEAGEKKNPIVIEGSSSNSGSASNGSSGPDSEPEYDNTADSDSDSNSDLFEDVPPPVPANSTAAIQPPASTQPNQNNRVDNQQLANRDASLLPADRFRSHPNSIGYLHPHDLSEQPVPTSSMHEYFRPEGAQRITVVDTRSNNMVYTIPDHDTSDSVRSAMYEAGSDLEEEPSDYDYEYDYDGDEAFDNSMVGEEDQSDFSADADMSLLHEQRLHEMQQRREQEEKAILDMPAAHFLETWLQLVTPVVLSYDASVAETMRRWLFEEPVSRLRGISWSVNRQLEKQPELDEDTVNAANDSRTTAVWPKVSCLTLMSNYIGFVLRWRQMRESSPEQNKNIRNIANSSEDSATGSSGNRGLQADSMELDPDSGNIAYQDMSNGSTLSAVDQTNGSGLVTEEEPSLASGIHHDTIFQKSRLLAEQEEAKMPPKSKAQADAVQKSKSSRNLDSDSSDNEFTDEEDFIDISPEQHPATQTTSLAADANEVAHQSEANAGDDGNHDDDANMMDLSMAEQEELLRSEQDEYALFVNKLRGAESDSTVSKTKSFEAMRNELQNELLSLRTRVRDSARDASGVGADMVEDIRMLLSLFGIPYITAPMEAEAQCATLISAGLVDGMVTDDSDAFLFAAAENTTVYRHFFQKDKFVEMYSSKNIYRDSNLTQRDFIFLAHLLGSDYTVGIKGIGPVLGMEALAEFGPGSDQSKVFDNDEESIIDALQSFGDWCRKVIDVLPGIEIPKELLGTAQRRRLAQVIRKSTIPAKFPDPRVVRAYLHPQVDDSDAEFTWGFPKLDLLRQFLSEKLGWSVEKTSETLVPLVRKMTEDKSSTASGRHQLTLDAYAVTNANATTQHSKRIGKAISSHKRHTNPDQAGPKKRPSAKVSHHPLI